ncbi:hypothetical protein Vadar_015067 [Vaccinium darrowii]|uniref:Uncharacterized protein n=1 Tax=Vaccinium darrowii TaxID=229202 RepID=A0ACB7Z6G5_9ERIC|nr:hypothetical protein Vadar_015067 [Vaccinium darrowii]
MEASASAKLFGKEISSVDIRGDGVGGSVSRRVVLVTDGAWLSRSLLGAFAWVAIDQNGVCMHSQAKQIRAHSAAMVEILAGVKVLEWASMQGVSEVVIQTDCLEFVRCARSPEFAHPLLQPLLYDFISLCSKFLLVRVIKVCRNVVKKAHSLAKGALRSY